MVKGLDKFWKVQVPVGGFNESRRKIASGVVKTDHESIIAIHFHTPPEGDLSHYSYIFMNTDPMGLDINNLACSRVDHMLQLDIQKGKEAMIAEHF